MQINDMAFSEKQISSIIESTRRLNIWEGSVRSGKTVASMWRWIEFVRTFPRIGDGSPLMVGKTHKALERNILDPIKQMVGARRCKYNRGTGTFTLFGVKCDLIGANDERAQDVIRGATVPGVYGDEITLWPQSFFKMMLSRMSVKGAKFFGTTNPDSPYHWLKTDYLDKAAELDLTTFHFNIDDNTNLDPAFVESLKKEYTGLWYKRFIDGLWVQAEGAIYDMWDEGRHMVYLPDLLADLMPNANKEDRRFRHTFMAVDYGTSNPFAAGLFGYNKDLPCYLMKEYYYDGKKSMKAMTDDEYVDELIKWLDGVKPPYTYVDPSAASFSTALRKRGFHVIEASNDVLDGIRFVANLFQKDLFKIDRSCTNTKKEVTGYIWDEKAQRYGEDKPVKQNDHCMDMMRYGLYTHFFKTKRLKILGFNYN